MTVGPDLVVDPAQAYLDAGPTAPTASEEPHHRIGVVLGSAFLVAAALMTKQLLEQPTPDSQGAARTRLEQAWRIIAPVWLHAALPAALHAYTLGSPATATSDEVRFLAAQYAEGLGDYVHKTSSDAVMEGFTAQLNAGWDRDLAWRRAVTGYGLDGRGMRLYITPLLKRPDSFTGVDIPDTAKHAVTLLLGRRATAFGDNEAYHAVQLARHLYWVWQQAHGELPPDAVKRWITAEDERVCKVCAPLDKVAIPLAESWTTANGERLLCPGVHPNCRCRMELSYPEIETPLYPGNRLTLAKAYQESEHPRARDGQWRTKPDVRTRTTEEPVTDPALSDLLSRAAQAAEETGQGARSLTRGAASLSAGEVSLSAGKGSLSAGKGSLGAGAPSLAAGRGLGRTLGRTLTPDTPFGASLRAGSTVRNVVHVFYRRQPDGRVEEETSTQTYDTDGTTQFWPGPAVMPADSYFTAVYRTSRLQPDRFGGTDVEDYLALRPGSIVDFDAVGTGQVVDHGGHQSWVSPAQDVLAGRDHQDPEVIPALMDAKEYMTQVSSAIGNTLRQQNDEMAYEESSTIEDDDELLAELIQQSDPEALVANARHLGASRADYLTGYQMSQDNPEAFARWVLERRAEEQALRGAWETHRRRFPAGEGPPAPDAPWSRAVSDLAANQSLMNLGDEIGAAHLSDRTMDDYEPTMFSFEGHFGSAPNLVEGAYRVDSMEFVPLTHLQRAAMDEEVSQNRADDVSTTFEHIRVVHLSPLDVPWVPQTPEEFARGTMPPLAGTGG